MFPILLMIFCFEDVFTLELTDLLLNEPIICMIVGTELLHHGEYKIAVGLLQIKLHQN